MNGNWGEGLGWLLLLLSLLYLLRFFRNTFAASKQGCGCSSSGSCQRRPAEVTQKLNFMPRRGKTDPL